ncbi:MAG: hypothetical protein Q9212_003821 [Teloschistes hypoglaucus]
MRVPQPLEVTGTRRPKHTDTASLAKYILNEPPLRPLQDPNTKHRKSSLDLRKLPHGEEFDRFPAASPSIALTAFKSQLECMFGEDEPQLILRFPARDLAIDESEHAREEFGELATIKQTQ